MFVKVRNEKGDALHISDLNTLTGSTGLTGVDMNRDIQDQADISVILPVFNGAAHIQACIDSLLNQTIMPCEIIVVDNGSTDDTVALAGRYEGVSLLAEKTPGAGVARNKGAKIAGGSILAFIDVDCRAGRDWIQEAWRIMRDRKAVHGLLGVAHGVNENLWAVFFQNSYDDFIKEIQGEDGRLLKVDTKNFFIRREVFKKTGGFDTAIGNSEDVDLGIRLHMAGYRIEYTTSVKISHLNPTRLSLRLRVRREQNFFDYTIFRKIPLGKGFKYFPAFNRFYSHYIFLKRPSPPRIFFLLLDLAVESSIQICKSLLIILKYLGLTNRLYPLDHLLMDFAAFQGKLFARMVEACHIEFGELVARGKFSRRLKCDRPLQGD